MRWSHVKSREQARLRPDGRTTGGEAPILRRLILAKARGSNEARSDCPATPRDDDPGKSLPREDVAHTLRDTPERVAPARLAAAARAATALVRSALG